MSALFPSPTPSLGPDVTPGDLPGLRLRAASAIFVIIVAALAAAVLAGAYSGAPPVPSLVPTLKASTALALLLAAAALGLYRMQGAADIRKAGMRASVAGAGVLALTSLLGHVSGWNVSIGQWLVPEGHAGPMALTTTFALLSLLGAVVLAERPGRYGPAQALTGFALLVAMFDGVGSIFGLGQALDPGTFGVISLPTSLSLLLLSLALLFARPAEGVMNGIIDAGPGGIIVRRLLPLFIVLPLLLAWLSWHGVRAGLYSPPFAISLVVTLTIVSLTLAVLSGGRILRSFEEKRQLAEALRIRTEGRLRRAVTDAPIPIVIHDGNQILNMSRAWAAVSGYDPTDTPTVSSWVERAQPEFVQQMPEYLGRLAAATETIAGGEQHVHTRSGERRIWDFSSTPLGQHGTDERMFVTMAVDVTARKQAEAELRGMNEGLEQRIAERTTELTRVNDALKRQSDQLREQALLLDLVRDGILVRDLYGTVVYWSAGATEMYGFDRAEALGRMSHQLLSTEYPLPLREIEDTVTRTGFWEGEVVQTTRTGTRLFVESRWTLTRTERGTPEGFMEVNRDITARKRAQDSLRDSELRFRAVAETAIEGIISLDASGTIRYWNPGAERLFGRPAAEAVGLPVATVMPEPFLAQRQPDADRALGTTFEAAGRRRDNSEFPLEISLVDWTNTQGTRFFTAIVRDITGRKEAERALQAKAEELARSNQELEQFAYVASHDLQEPLRMVSNYTQLLARRYKDALDAEAHEFIDFAVDGAKRMQELIHDLLQYARVGTRGKEFRPVPGARIVAEAMSNLARTIDESRAQVVVDPLPTLFCDVSQMVQVFQNLIANAVKFRREGQSPLIRVSASRAGRAWNLAVQDNGIGIEPKYFERIFQMFQRLHGRGEYAGTGIGLALCKKIVERHGGRIRVESEPNRGTTFSFTIPDTMPPA